MAKSLSLEGFSVEQLEEAIAARRLARADELREKRAEVMRELRIVEAALEAAAGQQAESTVRRRSGPRLRGGPSMASAVLRALAGSDSKDIGVRDLVEQVKGNTSSDKPGLIVSQVLLRLKKDGLVASGGRGLYRLTAEGKKAAAAFQVES